MSTLRFVLTGTVLAAAATIAAPTAAMAAPAQSAQQAVRAAWQGSCDPGDFCIWSRANGTGVKCSWDGDDPDWLGGNVQCTHNGKPYGEGGLPFLVHSYWNHGYTGSYSRVQLYSFKNYDGYTGTISASSRGYNTDDEGVLVRSHRWVN